VGDRIAKGIRAAQKLAKSEKREPSPVVVKTRDIAKTFWGKSWCDNLERYSDFANRLPRGKTYLRNGSVADLVIEPGVIRAIVGGSEAYKIVIKIEALKPYLWRSIERDCSQEIGSLMDLLQGKFSNDIMARLTRQQDGLFPAKNEISMSCTCPDGSIVCKHVAATIYGVGARLDSQPDLLFKLRKVNHLELIGKAATQENLDRALGAATGALEGEDLGSIFGIELNSDSAPASRPAKKAANQATNRPAKKSAKVKTESVSKVDSKAISRVISKVASKSASKTDSQSAAVEAVSPKVAKSKPAAVTAAEPPVATKRGRAKPPATPVAATPVAATPEVPTKATATKASATKVTAAKATATKATATLEASKVSGRLQRETEASSPKTRAPRKLK
jgi:uncharacterized Zn finger protein